MELNQDKLLSSSSDQLDEVFNEITERLKNIQRPMGFFFGAGISVPAGVPNLEKLTKNIENKLTGTDQENIKKFSSTHKNVEIILDLIRHVSLIKEKFPTLLAEEFKDIDFLDLDRKICKEIINEIQPKTGDTRSITESAKYHIDFVKWLNAIHNAHYPPVEIFTTNYDIFLELAMDNEEIPYIDGFLGAYKPFFRDRLVFLDDEENSEQIPKSWYRYWKLHGSINWRKTINDGRTQIYRTNNPEIFDESEDCLIQPSYFKLAETRLTPFAMLLDRFRRFLLSKERSLFILGYGFGDEHLNEIIIQGVKENPNLTITVLDFGKDDKISPKLREYALQYSNILAFGPDQYIWGRCAYSWNIDDTSDYYMYFDEEKKNVCKFGDFRIFTSFLISQTKPKYRLNLEEEKSER